MSDAGVYMLQEKHADALPGIASSAGTDAAAFVAARIKERDAGTGAPFVIEERGQVVGACGLQGIGGGAAKELWFWVAPPFRGKGYATFGVRMILEFAFRNQRLEEVHARTLDADAAARRVLEKNGFRREPGGTASYAITAEGWRGDREGPALGKLHPGLKAILDDERAAGNEILETQVGWPEPGSVFVKLRRPFAARRDLPKGVTFAEINDPHWWTAEYRTDSPRHTLAY